MTGHYIFEALWIVVMMDGMALYLAFNLQGVPSSCLRSVTSKYVKTSTFLPWYSDELLWEILYDRWALYGVKSSCLPYLLLASIIQQPTNLAADAASHLTFGALPYSHLYSKVLLYARHMYRGALCIALCRHSVMIDNQWSLMKCCIEYVYVYLCIALENKGGARGGGGGGIREGKST